ncbi:class I adenylate-forming enzyme family protein [Neobacillus sp.]|uniref:class I adenylate-forming enzyme family protein n=1 Tax=Neobacillus sp. TaxID=2675273 RepID=UPI00289EDD67|nr:class I adenylate-forming enzyme family protein [Neobacillus sp.]
MLIAKDFYDRIGYPEEWLTDAKKYNKNESYVIYDPSWDEPIPEIPQISIYSLFKRSVEKYPDRIAMVYLDNQITYREFDLLIDKFAFVLRDLGIKKGDTICPMLPPSLQHWITFLAIAKLGAISAPINVMFKEQEISFQIKDCGATTVVVLDVFYPYFHKLRDDLNITNIIVTNIKDFASPNFNVYDSLKPYWDFPKKKLDNTLEFFELIKSANVMGFEEVCDPKQDVVKIIYTSGTTGNPKGAMETHLNLVHNTVTHAHLIPSKRPINFTFLPMNHTGGYLVFQLPTFYLGGTVIPRPIFDIEDAFHTIQTYKVNTVFGPPTFFIGLLQHPKLKEYDLSSLSFTTAGAAEVPESLMKLWKDRIGIDLAVGWGGTETNCMGTWSILKNKKNPLSVGLPYIGEVKVISQQGSTLPRGQVGEILFRGLQVSKGYFNNPVETSVSFQNDGWFRTGDAGYIDREGFLHYVDRIKDLIIASGYNIAPIEVENIIKQHSSVREVAVIGVPHEYRGETVKAYVVISDEFKGQIIEQDIIDFCREKMAPYKIPTSVELIPELPKNMMGKTLRRVLRDKARKKE